MRATLMLLLFVASSAFAQAGDRRELSDEEVFGSAKTDTKKDINTLISEEFARIYYLVESKKIKRSDGNKLAASAVRTYFPSETYLISFYDQLAAIELQFEKKQITKNEYATLKNHMYERFQSSRAARARELEEALAAEAKRSSDMAQAAQERERNRRLQQQQAEAERAAYIAEQESQANRAFLGNMFRSIGNSMNRTYQQPAYQPPVRCNSSSDFSGTVSTTCY